MGTAASPSILQAALETAFSEWLGTHMLIYADDPTLGFGTWDELLEVGEAVFKRIAELDLQLSAKKCSIGRERIVCLGHGFGPEGVRPVQEQADKIAEMRTPQSKAELRSALGCIAFVSPHVVGFGPRAKRLYELTGAQAAWSWQQQHEDAWRYLKNKVGRVKRGRGRGVDAGADGRPGQDVETGGYPQLGVDGGAEAVQHDRAGGVRAGAGNSGIRQCITGEPDVTLWTDNKPLTGIWGQKDQTRRLARLESDLGRLGVNERSLRHVAGAANPAADYFSRFPEEDEFAPQLETDEAPVLMSEEQVRDLTCSQILLVRTGARKRQWKRRVRSRPSGG